MACAWFTRLCMFVACVSSSTVCAEPAPRASQPALAYIAIGGGATPESTEVSLEQNLQLAREVLHGPGALYFAGGQGSRTVRVESEEEPAALTPLLVRVGDLFNPRVGRRSSYRMTDLPAQPSTLPAVEAGLIAALSAGGDPLLLFISAHGQQGDSPAANSVALWGGETLTVARLAELHDAHPRPLRVLAASCFSGGFGELAFTAADAKQGATQAPRCGLFAGTWDRETSGCDPDPDRRNQEGYSMHVLQALKGRDRDGQALPPFAIDVNHDGRISLLEAHARATVAGRSIDVPTTTSERYLRSVQRKGAPANRALLPEYASIVDGLGAELGLPNRAAADARGAALQKALDAALDAEDAAEADVNRQYAALTGRLLARWPVLDDPYSPEFARELARDADAIADALTNWPEAQRYYAAQRVQNDRTDAAQELELSEAIVLRLRKAYETLELAAALHKRGGPRFAQYARLLACERYVPPQ